MRILLDTHVWLWWNSEPNRLSPTTLEMIGDIENEVYLSAASVLELAIKARIGKLPLPEPVNEYVAKRIIKDEIRELPIRYTHAAVVQGLPLTHRDPFDLLLIAQSQHENLTLLTADTKILAYAGNMIDARHSI